MGNNCILESILRDGIVTVRINIKYPISGDKKIDGYIKKTAEALRRFAYKKLAARAAKAHEQNGEFEPFSLVVSCKVTLDNESFFAFYFDLFVYENGRKSAVKRIPFNFDRRNSDIFFPLKNHRRRELNGALELSLTKIGAADGCYADFQRRARKKFDKSNVIMTPDGIYATFDSGILCPHERGAMNVLLVNLQSHIL